MSDEIDVYRKLQQHLDKLPIGFPPTRRGEDIKVLKHYFSPEEAEIATHLSFSFDPVKKIHERLEKAGVSLSIEDLEKKLEKMVANGGINRKKEGDQKYYANLMLVIGMYEHKIYQLTMEFLEDFFKYGTTFVSMEMFRTKIPQLRTIPIEESIKHESFVESYDNLKKIIENSEGPFVVQVCICRKAKDMYNDPCKVTSREETCVGIGHSAQLYIDQGWGRQVSKEELLEILRKNEEDGLVLQPGNYLNPNYICSCCSCCCGILASMNVYPKPIEYFATNHYAEIDAELCSGCETCIDRCQMGALKIVDNISTVNLDRCIGCGVCVPTCPSDAIHLRKKEEIIVPPTTSEELYDRILNKKNELIKEEEEKKERRRKRREEKRKKAKVVV